MATNWALVANGASATASSTYSTYVAGNAIDGNDATAWMSTNPITGKWLRVDLGQARSVGGFRMAQSDPLSNNGISAYKLQKSTNDVDWTDVLVVSSAAADEKIIFAAQTARYWRMLATAGGGGGTNVPTIELWDSPPMTYPYTVGQCVYGFQYASLGTDGSEATYWSSAQPVADRWLKINYGESKVFSGYRLKQGAAASTYEAYSYKIQTSNDGLTWTDVYTRAATAPEDETITFGSPSNAQYIRVIAVTGGIHGWQIFEFTPTIGAVAAAQSFVRPVYFGRF